MSKLRTYGIEQEFGNRPFIEASHVRELVDLLGIAHIGEFLINGYRVYWDVGHLEISTPQQSNIRSVTAAYLGGHVMAQSLQDTPVTVNEMVKVSEEGDKVERYAPRDVLKLLKLDANLVDSYGSMWGLHENYDTTIDQYNIPNIFVFASAFATRMEFSAGNVILGENGKPRLERSQRASGVMKVYGDDTTINRPLFHQGRESHGGDGRLHYILSDARMIPANISVPMGLTAGLLTLAENGHDLTDLILDDPVKAANVIGADDPESLTPVVLADDDGKEITHIDHLQMQAEKILAHGDEVTDEIKLLAGAAYDYCDERRLADPMKNEAILDGQSHPHVNFNDAIAKKEQFIRAVDKGLRPAQIHALLMNQWATMDPEKNFVYKARARARYMDDPLDSFGIVSEVVSGDHVTHPLTKARKKFIERVECAEGIPESILEIAAPHANWAEYGYTTLRLLGQGGRIGKEPYKTET